jgi:hypothetical protein
MRFGVAVIVALASSTAVAEQAPEPPSRVALPELEVDISKLPKTIGAAIEGMPDAETAELKVVFADGTEKLVSSTAVRRTLDGPPAAIAIVAPEMGVRGVAFDMLDKAHGQLPEGSQLTIIRYWRTAEVTLPLQAIEKVKRDAVPGAKHDDEPLPNAADEAIELAIAELSRAPAGTSRRMLVMFPEPQHAEPMAAARKAGIWFCWAEGGERLQESLSSCESKIVHQWSATFDVSSLQLRGGLLLSVGAGFQWTDTLYLGLGDPAPTTKVEPTKVETTKTETTPKRQSRVWWAFPLIGLALVALLVWVRRR